MEHLTRRVPGRAVLLIWREDFTGVLGDSGSVLGATPLEVVGKVVPSLPGTRHRDGTKERSDDEEGEKDRRTDMERDFSRRDPLYPVKQEDGATLRLVQN